MFLFFISFQMPFPALVSGFNKRCFLRSRCSMKMWCPDDTGRDSWDWVGPPAGESMLQLPRVGWRLLACKNGTSPDCTTIVVFVVVAVVQTIERGTRVCPGVCLHAVNSKGSTGCQCHLRAENVRNLFLQRQLSGILQRHQPTPTRGKRAGGEPTSSLGCPDP